VRAPAVEEIRLARIGVADECEGRSGIREAAAAVTLRTCDIDVVRGDDDGDGEGGNGPKAGAEEADMAADGVTEGGIMVGDDMGGADAAAGDGCERDGDCDDRCVLVPR